MSDVQQSQNELADLGVVFVHGIGSQTHGTTLKAFSDPLISWTDAWSRARGGSGASVTESRLQPTEGPPFVDVTISLPDQLPIRWHLTEARWSESFPPPDAVDVFRWGTRFVFVAAKRLWSHLSRPVDLTMNWLHDEKEAAKKAPAQAAEAMLQLPGAARANAELGSFGVMLQAAIYFVVATFAIIIYSGAYAAAAISAIFAIAVFTAAIAIVLSVAVTLPVIRYLVARPVTALVTSVGDAHVWKKIPDSAKAMSDVVQERARDTNGRARKTVLVAHSRAPRSASTRSLNRRVHAWTAWSRSEGRSHC